jgi:antitoxin ParD1/3/4
MPTMNVSLSQELAAFVEDEVASGEYTTASEVVRDGLRHLLRDRELRPGKLAILRREIGQGIDQARSGKLPSRSVDEIAAGLRGRAERREPVRSTSLSEARLPHTVHLPDERQQPPRAQ